LGKIGEDCFWQLGAAAFFWGLGIIKKYVQRACQRIRHWKVLVLLKNIFGGAPSAKRNKIENIKCNGGDRADSSLPYSKENSVPCCKYFNNMKGKMNKNHFLRYVSEIYEH
jgi:hypothetical protein